MNNERIKKLESVAHTLVTNFIFEEMAEESTKFGIITVTGVRISSDISYLDVYVSSLLESEGLTKALASHCSQIQRKFNKSVPIRKLPRIRFRYDETGAVGEDVCRAINDLDL
ncbi:MAG: ribosome-binding factor A [Candidatus Gracilibacteria bacterium]|nr:ribosome-binding factor A [Candidatus Gracilibacteria bacterium]